MSESSNAWDAIVGLAWPFLIGGSVWWFRDEIRHLLNALSEKLESASELKLGGLELKGPPTDKFQELEFSGGRDYKREVATEQDERDRQQVYKDSRYFMLTHRIRPSKVKGQEFDISIYLTKKITERVDQHSRYELVDIEKVEYYLGRFFGDKPHGSKFVVRNAKDGFAITTSSYGPPLCIAHVTFKDGHRCELRRYLDFEMRSVFPRRSRAKKAKPE